ncbi:MAG: hypothetical protein ACYS80_06150 [Planctomycetota bacterium]|jgi:hypothetical protein
MENIRHNKEKRFVPGAKKLISIVKRGLESRYIPVIVAGLAALIMLPALNAGFIQDDLFHRIRLVQPSQLPEQLYCTGLIPPDAGRFSAALRDMHSFTRTKQDTDKLKDSGLCPWWTNKDLRFANWRPLDSFTHWLDYRLFPDSPPLMHLHNIIWLAAVIFLLTILYRQLVTPIWMAALAALLYTIDDSNYFPAMWIANRNLLLALFFSILTLLLHHRWREHNSLAAGVAAPFTLLLSLLSTEAGIATFAYLFAYALIIDRESRMQRLVSLAPSFIIICAWRLIYNALGYGASGSGFIIDPGREPLRYALAVLQRAPILLTGQWGWQPAEMFNFFSEYARGWYLFAAKAFLVLVLIVLIPLLRKNRVALYWFVGMLLCVLPICATSPMNRNLLFVAIGAFGLMAQFLGGFFIKEKWIPKSRYWRVPAWIVAAAGRIKAPRMISFVFDTFNSTIKIDPSVDLTNKTLVVVNAPHPFLYVGLPFLRDHFNEPLPERTRLLAPGFGPLEIIRTGEKTLLVKALTGNILSTDTSQKDFIPNFVYFYNHFNILFRPENLPFQVGERTELGDMSAEILNVDSNGQPTQVLFRFAVSLDDPSLSWFKWNWEKSGFGDYATFKVPTLGQTIRTEGPFSDI